MNLSALPFHLRVRDHFKQQTKTWNFFAAGKNKDEQLQQFKTELLKNTYKFDETADKHIYNKVAEAKDKLSLQQLPVTVYQAQFTDELNASIIYINNEAHIVFSGRITQLMDDQELLAIIAHELTHIKLYSLLEGELEIADRIITAIANNYNTDAAYYETARLFKLYTEIYCDRGAYLVTGSTDAVIASLVKVATGLDKVNAESYTKQADEIFEAEYDTKTASFSHPENFIRARAIQLWHNNQVVADNEIAKMIEGVTNIDQLNIFQQKELTDITRTFLQLFLKPKWFRSAIITNLAKEYFNDFNWKEDVLLTSAFIEKITNAHSSIKNYLGYVLLDFAMADISLEEIPQGWAFQFAEDVHLKETFGNAFKKELHLSDKKLQQHKQRSLAAFHDIKENEAEQIYE